MNRREKILAAIVGRLLCVAVFGLGGRALKLKPLREIDKKAGLLRDRLDKLRSERRAFFIAQEEVKKTARRSFDFDLDKVSAKSAELLTQQILLAGLPEMEFTRLPFGPRKVRGAQEIGWNVQGDGTLDRVVNLLFLLQEDTHLHRIDGLTLSTGESPGQVRVRFRYTTLVLDPAPDAEPVALQAKFTLDSAQRRVFDGILQMDILRPYINRPAVGVPGQPGSKSPGTSPGGPPGSERFKVVSLSEWQGQPEVHVRDLVNQKTLRFKPGDSLAGGTLTLIDYRKMPKAGKQFLDADSRAIVRIGEEYWAIETGKTLAQKYRLNPDQLPDSLAAAKPAGR